MLVGQTFVKGESARAMLVSFMVMAELEMPESSRDVKAAASSLAMVAGKTQSAKVRPEA